jgi:hypothetical protein
MEVVVAVKVSTAVVVQVLVRVLAAEERPVLPIPLKAPINHPSLLKHYCTGEWNIHLKTD